MESGDRALKRMRALPPPTPRQSAAFASYVSSAHSWYKHLPSNGNAHFYLYPDPHSGDFYCYEAKGRKVFRPLDDVPAGHPHYSSQSTADYRRRFGFWQYTVNLKAFFSYEESEHVEDSIDFSLRIVDSDGFEVEVPKQLQRLGRVGLSALFHPHPRCDIWESQFAKRPGADRSCSTPCLREFLRLREETSPQLGDPPTLPNGIAKEIENGDWLGKHVWKMELYFDQLLDESRLPVDARQELFPRLLEYAECMRTRDEFRYVARVFSHSPPPADLLLPLIKERLRQLRRFKHAMDNVVDFLYLAGNSSA
jgi:hypothetical protein